MSGAQKRRIGIAFIYHESHSFSPLLAGLEAFAAEDHHLGDKVIDVYSETSTEVGGFLSVLHKRGDTPVALIAAAAMPAGEVTAEAYSLIREQFRSSLRAEHESSPLDGLLLAMHGSMIAQNEQDPEGTLIRDAREILGAHVPIGVTVDLHANLSSEPVRQGALLFGYQTYPHTDMREQGERAAEAVLDVLDGTPLFVRMVQLPMLLRSINMRTQEGPMADVVAFARQQEGDGVYSVSPHSGFPYGDTFCSGTGVTVVADNPDVAEQVCAAVAQFFWDQRERYQVDVPLIADAIAEARVAIAALETPVVLADVADNPQSGGSADTTKLLREVLRADLGRTLASAIYDQGILDVARQAGLGARVTAALGGKQSPEYGRPLEVEATILAVSDGMYINDGPFNAGLQVNTGGAVLIRVHAVVGIDRRDEELGICDVVVTGRPITANDPALYRLLGVDPLDYRVLVWKVKNHFRAAFAPLVGKILPVDAPGAAQTDFTQLNFVHTDRSKWPFDESRELGMMTCVRPSTSVL